MSLYFFIEQLVYLYWTFWSNSCSFTKIYSMKKTGGFVVVLLWCLPPFWGEAGGSFACYLKYTNWMILTGMLTITGDFRYIRHLFSENPIMCLKKSMLDVHLTWLRWSKWRRQAGSRHFILHEVELPQLYILTAISHDKSYIFHIRIFLPPANGLFPFDFTTKTSYASFIATLIR